MTITCHPKNIKMLQSWIHSGNKFLVSKAKCCLRNFGVWQYQNTNHFKNVPLDGRQLIAEGASVVKPTLNSVALYVCGLSVMTDEESFDTPFPT